MTLKARIVILNYQGGSLLPQCLPSVVEAARVAKTPTAVTVLDNLSTDGSEAYVRSHFPDVEFVKAPRNLVLCSYNEYLKTIKEPVAILLNNDICVAKDFVDPLLEKFEDDPRTFLVAPRVMSFDGAAIEAVDTRFRMRWGMPQITARYPGYEAHAMVPDRTFASGFGAFSSEKFAELGGYDRRFLPGIFEDADLCLRAAQKGYSMYYEPRSVVFHMGQASFKKAFSSFRRESVAWRNTFLFVWKNFRGAGFRIPHIAFFLPRVLWTLARGNAAF
ncbi:MAG: glycosyltransferase, partial [Candidatus Omnitrophica bacterium]|nr:glycosyltransferase [Candidatus Omnitrophota bacterium]